jgi:ABC-type protease/lipase transport system fused ATPase/permease subunit
MKQTIDVSERFSSKDSVPQVLSSARSVADGLYLPWPCSLLTVSEVFLMSPKQTNILLFNYFVKIYLI